MSQQQANSTDKAVLTVPANVNYARVVRIFAANLATVQRMNVDEVEDVRMAAEEAFVYVIASQVGSEVEITARLLSDGSLHLDFPVGNTDPVDAVTDQDAMILELAQCILESTCDKAEIINDGDTLHLEKIREGE